MPKASSIRTLPKNDVVAVTTVTLQALSQAGGAAIAWPMRDKAEGAARRAVIARLRALVALTRKHNGPTSAGSRPLPMTDPGRCEDFPPEAAQPGSLGAWWRQGVRAALLLSPQWSGLQTTPLLVLCLVAAPHLLGMVGQRLLISGPASFDPRALLMGWLTTLLLLWMCWQFVPRPQPDPADPRLAPSAIGLFSMMMAQAFVIGLVVWSLYVPLLRNGWFTAEVFGKVGVWAVWGLLAAWPVVATVLLAWRAGARRRLPRVCIALAIVGVMGVGEWTQSFNFWRADAPEAEEEPGPEPLALTQELMEAQPKVLAERLQALTPQRRGVVDVYAITFAPYAPEDVFMRESQLVAEVMQQRFGSTGRTLQLVNHRDTGLEWPWATPLNLQRAIQRAAALMDKEEDVLFIHLTSHGARGGPLAASLGPVDIGQMTPLMLKAWLDEAGVRWSVVSVSACYSGSWIEPLAGEGMLVMTAADADHTSYGCGRRSPLTYFGRAMYDEQLRHTLSFEQAHGAAKAVIEQREKDAGKPDGFSNPQIQVGDKVREKLVQLEAQRAMALR